MIVITLDTIDNLSLSILKLTIQSIKKFLLFEEDIKVYYFHNKLKKIDIQDIEFIKIKNINEYYFCPIYNIWGKSELLTNIDTEIYYINNGTILLDYYSRIDLKRKTCLKLFPPVTDMPWSNNKCIYQTAIDMFAKNMNIYTPFPFGPFSVTKDELIEIINKFSFVKNNTASLPMLAYSLMKSKRKKIVYKQSSLKEGFFSEKKDIMNYKSIIIKTKNDYEKLKQLMNISNI